MIVILMAHRLVRSLGCALVLGISSAPGQTAGFAISGQVTDPQAQPAAHLKVQVSQFQQDLGQRLTDETGRFTLNIGGPGDYVLKVIAPGFQDVNRNVSVIVPGNTVIDVQLGALSGRHDSTTVVADIKDESVLFPDPAQRVYVRDNLLDANPGRPGAPVSIPGLPIETASGGIKAPQYFSPGVAGDHGEPIAEYVQVGSYLVSNNLSSNAHGNGYADPNIFVPAILEGVQTDGGAFNVREGNHAENLSAIYELRPRFEPFITVTGDYRDGDIVAGWGPGEPSTKAWIALEAAYGNGFLDRLEHRKQFKFNGFRVWDVGEHELTLFAIGYFGTSYIPGLVPVDIPNLHDTIDQRQRDQTHTGELALNDVWRLSPQDQLQLSGVFRTYDLSLQSNFGDGLIRQSEFRTVTGGNVSYIRTFNSYINLLAGVDYQRDAPRRLDLDRNDSADPSVAGSFQKISANNVTLSDTAPFIALQGALPGNLHYYLGWRRDEIQFDNQDLLFPQNSLNRLAGFNSPKGTLAYSPANSHWLPSLAFSFGEAFYTNDPRVGTGTTQGTPISREHSYQAVISKSWLGTDFRVTLAHITTEASLAKIDPDTGLQEDEGPGRNKYITVAARHYFKYGLLQGSVSKADARDLDSGLPTPEAPRLIVDVLGTVNRLPFRLQARGEFEEVGAKPLGDDLKSVPVREFRGSLVRSFLENRMDLGVNFLIASGFTGQTLETLALPNEGDPFERVVGVRLPSYVSISYSYHFRPKPTP